jgi:hypothetical protein
MCDLLTDPYLESLRGKSAVLDRLMVALNETFPATPAADTNPCVEAVGGGTFEQGDAA